MHTRTPKYTEPTPGVWRLKMAPETCLRLTRRCPMSAKRHAGKYFCMKSVFCLPPNPYTSTSPQILGEKGGLSKKKSRILPDDVVFTLGNTQIENSIMSKLSLEQVVARLANFSKLTEIQRLKRKRGLDSLCRKSPYKPELLLHMCDTRMLNINNIP